MALLLTLNGHIPCLGVSHVVPTLRRHFTTSRDNFKSSWVIPVSQFASRTPILLGSKASSTLVSFPRHLRLYSSRESRRAQRVLLKERTEALGSDVVPRRESYHLHDSNSIQSGSTNDNFIGYDPDTTTESLMTPSVMQHLRKVYSTIAAMIGMSAIGGASSVILPATLLASAPIIGLVGSLGCMLGIYFTDPKKIMFRQNLLLGFGFLSGISLTGLLTFIPATTIIMALAGTTAIFAGFSLAALRAKSTTFLSMGGILYGGVFALLGISLIGWLGPMLALPISPAFYAALHNINLYLGLGIFSFFISYDTQRMITSAYEGNTDHVSDALGMFINVYSIFVRLLAIFRDE